MLEFLKSIIITPLSFLWEKVYQLRRSLYNCGVLKQNTFQIPVISIGNITFGGTGKTPFTIWLSKFSQELSLAPVIVTRGYKGAHEHGFGYIDGKKTFQYSPVDFGDEPLIIARRLTKGGVIVGKKRSENLNFAFHKFNPDVVILDDGFQHLKMFRDFNIVLFDALMPISQYHVAPKGYLREGVTALRDADAIVISRADQVNESKLRELEQLISKQTKNDVIWSRIHYVPSGLFNTNFEKTHDVDFLHGKKIIACSALASPESFHRMLEDLGAEIVEKVSYPDHYFFNVDDVEELEKKSRDLDALIITTEKDIVKIRKISTELSMFYIEVEVEFLSGGNELKDELRQKLGGQL